MSEPFRVELINLPEFKAAVAKGPRVISDELFVSAKTLALRGEQLSKNYLTANWQGNALASIYSNATRSASGVEAIFGASAEYAIVIDKGRRAGAPMPPSGVMLPWMSSKSIPAEAEFPIRRAIGRKGISARPFVTKAFNELKAGLAVTEFGKAIARAMKRIGGGG